MHAVAPTRNHGELSSTISVSMMSVIGMAAPSDGTVSTRVMP